MTEEKESQWKQEIDKVFSPAYSLGEAFFNGFSVAFYDTGSALFSGIVRKTLMNDMTKQQFKDTVAKARSEFGFEQQQGTRAYKAGQALVYGGLALAATAIGVVAYQNIEHFLK